MIVRYKRYFDDNETQIECNNLWFDFYRNKVLIPLSPDNSVVLDFEDLDVIIIEDIK